MGFKCRDCKKEIEDDFYFKCNECESYNICRGCRQSCEHEHKLIKTHQEIKEEPVETVLDPKEKLKNMIDNYENQKIDKVIAKDLPTRFHYTKVEADDYGCNDEMVLLLDDRTLNQYVPLKRLAPYNDKVNITINLVHFPKKSTEKKI